MLLVEIIEYEHMASMLVIKSHDGCSGDCLVLFMQEIARDYDAYFEFYVNEIAFFIDCESSRGQC